MTTPGKIIWAINSTIDGYADHTAGIADDELHERHAELLDNTDILIFGRITYELMVGFWPGAKQYPGITESIVRFADTINSKQKIVFSTKLKEAAWENTTLLRTNLVGEIEKLKLSGKKVGIGSLSIASTLLKENMIDEFWIFVHPVLLGKGVPLTGKIIPKTNLKLISSEVMGSGVIVGHYER